MAINKVFFLKTFLFLLILSDPLSVSVAQESTPEATVTDILTDDKGNEMGFVPSGTFQMGFTLEHAVQLCEQFRSPDATICSQDFISTYVQPIETVEVEAFYMDLYEVTIADYLACVDIDICSWEPLRNLPPDSGNDPIRAVSYYDAAIYCASREARLPTEAEWEYAARGSQNLDFPWGNEFNGDLLNFCDVNCPTTAAELRSNQWDDGYTEAAPIDAHPEDRSWAGIYNLAGNVSEWTSTPPPPYPLGGDQFSTEYRITKGGSYGAYPYQTAGWFRGWVEAENIQIAVGFRCARTITPN